MSQGVQLKKFLPEPISTISRWQKKKNLLPDLPDLPVKKDASLISLISL
jgi:hypothetical protein